MQLAYAVGVSVGTLSEWERGSREPHGVYVVGNLALRLGVRYEWLMFGTGPRKAAK
jgi:transcriptional regulator with XRE-family HTH domain